MKKRKEKKQKPLKQVSGAVKFDDGKPRYDLLSEPALEGLANVLKFGAAKYANDNWRKGMEWRRLIRAAMGHLLAFSKGEQLDPDSGLPTIDHVQACVHFLSEYEKRGLGTDDRFKRKVKK